MVITKHRRRVAAPTPVEDPMTPEARQRKAEEFIAGRREGWDPGGRKVTRDAMHRVELPPEA